MPCFGSCSWTNWAGAGSCTAKIRSELSFRVFYFVLSIFFPPTYSAIVKCKITLLWTEIIFHSLEIQNIEAQQWAPGIYFYLFLSFLFHSSFRGFWVSYIQSYEDNTAAIKETLKQEGFFPFISTTANENTNLLFCWNIKMTLSSVVIWVPRMAREIGFRWQMENMHWRQTMRLLNLSSL